MKTLRQSTIYAWVCPITGKPVYVGKTSMPLEARQRSHRREAARWKTTKARWLNELMASGRLPRVVILETTTVARSATVERRWQLRLSSRFDLLNQATAGSGNPGIGRVSWTPEILALLGTVPDSQIAAQIGCERKTVSYRRQCLGIPASFDRTNNIPPPANGGWNRKTLPDRIIAVLGTVPDWKLAEQAGVSKKRIMDERHRRGIPSYAAATGNDGKIKLGEPHRRWNKRKFAPSPDPKVASWPARPM